MVNEIHVTVRGNAVGDAMLRRSDGGTPWTTFRLGTTARRYDARQGEWTDGTTQWFGVKVFGRMAEHVAYSVHKGAPILVRGVLTTEEWVSKEGEKRSTMTIVADSVALEMSRGHTTYIRVAEENGPEQQAADGAGDGTVSADGGTTVSGSLDDPWAAGLGPRTQDTSGEEVAGEQEEVESVAV